MLRKRIKKNTLKWKKIYAEQLLDMMDEEENALQKIYLTGYVLELKKNRYFAGWYKDRIVCRSLEYARYFPSAEAAEEYVHKYLGFAGMTCYICHVNWTLASCGSENMEDNEENLLEENGKILSFANYADGDYLIVEKEDEVGGYCRTIKEKDYVWDYAGHFFHFSTDEFKKRFIDSVDEDEIIYKDKNTKIIYKGELVDYPFQTNIHQLEKSEFIDCLYDLFHKEEKEEYDNFLDMLYGKFGKSIVEKFLKPYNEKLYAVDLTTLDKDAMGRFFPYADIPAIIDNMKANKDSTSYNNSFLYPRSGAGSFIQILYDALDKEKVLLNHVVDKIDRANKK